MPPVAVIAVAVIGGNQTRPRVGPPPEQVFSRSTGQRLPPLPQGGADNPLIGMAATSGRLALLVEEVFLFK